jgi:hypothetical protein
MSHVRTYVPHVFYSTLNMTWAVAGEARHVSAFKISVQATANITPGITPGGCWMLGERELQDEVVQIEAQLTAHATELVSKDSCLLAIMGRQRDKMHTREHGTQGSQRSHSV